MVLMVMKVVSDLKGDTSADKGKKENIEEREGWKSHENQCVCASVSVRMCVCVRVCVRGSLW